MRLLTAIASALILSGSALAQRGAGTSITIAPRPQVPMHQRHFAAPIFLGGAWYPGYGPDVVQTTPQVIVLQTTPTAAPVVKEDPKPITPLMIELQGGQYVRSDRAEKPVRQAGESAVTKAKVSDARLVSNAVVPAILVF